jgi:putative DNA primase/helicase
MQDNYMPLTDIYVNEKNNSDLSNDELDSLVLERDKEQEEKNNAIQKASKKEIEFFHYSERKERSVKTTLENLTVLLDSMGIKPKYNEQRRETVLYIDDKPVDYSEEQLSKIKSHCNYYNMQTGDVPSFINTIARANKFNPVLDWINSKPWDGESRLDDFFATITTKDTALRDVLIRKWMISAYAALVEPDGVEAHGVLVFQGDQGIGKTRWFNTLVPRNLEATKAGVILNPSDKDSVHQALQHWLVELGELDATFRKSDIAQLKAFITNSCDVYRLPYDKRSTKFARRTVFFSSVNDYKFLHDTTGNRRFWVIPADKIDYRHKFDMQQVWAEVQFWYNTKAPYWLNTSETEKLQQHLRGHTQVCPIEENISTVFDWSRNPTTEMTATQVATHIGVKDIAKGNREVNRCAAVLRSMNVQTRIRDGRTLYFMPPFR